MNTQQQKIIFFETKINQLEAENARLKALCGELWEWGRPMAMSKAKYDELGLRLKAEGIET